MILQPGDVVSVVAPAAQMRDADHGLLERGVALLESWGLRVRVRVAHGRHFYLAGDDEARARHLAEALGDPDTRAIFCARGGYGSSRLLTRLASVAVPSRRRLVGFSDVTSLHLAAARLWPDIACLHAPNLATRQLLGDGEACRDNRDVLHQALFDPGHAFEATIEMLHPGQARGPLVGGCLSLVVASLGTPFAPATRDALLFLEDVDEEPYRVDRMLTHMRLAGLFDGVRAVVFGEMHECADPHNDLKAVIADALDGLTMPIGFGLPCGHGARNLALPLGGEAEIDGQTGRFSSGGVRRFSQSRDAP